MTRVRCRIVATWSEDAHRLVILQDEGTGKIKIATGLEWREVEEGAMFNPREGIGPADDLIQAIINEAWEQGFRPTGFDDTKHKTAALEAHLHDMRALVFKKVEPKP